jgi:hypothetical protein
MNDPIQYLDSVHCQYPWCTTDHAGPVFDAICWTEPEQFEAIGQHGPAVNEQVRVQGSLNADEVPPARVHVDTPDQ